MPLLQVPRGRKPLSLWDWRVWPQAKPHLWRYGDAGNLYFDESLEQGRATYLNSQEWIACLLTREEMEYDVYDGEGFSARWPAEGMEINRFAEDWPTQHLFQTLYTLCEQKQSTFAFLKNGGMAFASRVRSLSAETLAAAARMAPSQRHPRTHAEQGRTADCARCSAGHAVVSG